MSLVNGHDIAMFGVLDTRLVL